MMKKFACAAAVLAAALSTACAGFEQSNSLLAPTGSSVPSGVSVVPSLVGTWTTAGQTSTGSSCTNLQWRVTAQSGNGLSGEFSADCVGNISIAGTVSGQLNGQDVSYQIAGSGSAPGVANCPFSVSGTAHLEGDSIRIPYTGTTCLGPIRGEETLRRPTEQSRPAAPEPDPVPEPEPPPPPPAASPYHVGSGPLSYDRAKAVVFATANEFAYLKTPRGSDGESRAAAEELLRRILWHLQLAGFQAGRQRNPSGAISGDKITIVTDNQWQAYDLFRDYGVAGQAIDVIFLTVSPPNSLPDGGIAD